MRSIKGALKFNQTFRKKRRGIIRVLTIKLLIAYLFCSISGKVAKPLANSSSVGI